MTEIICDMRTESALRGVGHSQLCHTNIDRMLIYYVMTIISEATSPL